MSTEQQSQDAARPSEWLPAGLFGTLLLALLAPWPRPAVPLRDVCELWTKGS